MYTETEDLVPDVIAKAQRGLNISDLELESLANISSGELAAVKKLH
ncbi:MAG: MBL fold metallo-hydrolase, partial [Verrucomicrobia bacterium CG_4_9_14_3_um_filter_43_20]